MGTKKNRALYQFKMTLLGSSPPIWRRIQVWADYTLHQLHRVLQSTMLWENYHLYEFRVGRKIYREPHPENEQKILDSRRTRILKVLPHVGTEFDYLYDFGDDWHHALLLEAILLPSPGITYPRCTGGERSGPPEDAGGPGGYSDYLEAMADPGHKRHEECMGWRGPLDPESFSVAKINQRLEKEFSPAPRRVAQKPNDAKGALSLESNQLLRDILSAAAFRPESRIRIKPNDTVPLELNERERQLILSHTFAGEELTDRLRVVPIKGERPNFHFTLDDLEELAGYVAAEANHAESRKLEEELANLFDRIQSTLNIYAEESPIIN